MKRITVCGWLLFVMMLWDNLQAATGPTEKIRRDIACYFDDCLHAKGTSYENSKPLRRSETSAYRQWVWDAWKAANEKMEEEKLIPLGELSSSAEGAWHLPEELEPHAVMNYYWGSKGAERPSDGYPMFLYTHGSGPKQMEWETGLSICSLFEDAPSVYFIPQIPNEGSYYRWWQKSKQYAWERLFRQVLASGVVNPDKLYIFGISEGGYGSQRLASFYADYLAGAGPMAGGEPLKNAPAENCAHIAFSLLTGAEDYGYYRNILTGYVKDEFGRLRALHPELYTHRIELIPGRGHAIDYRTTTPWLRQHTRNPYPKYVCWEDFEMDGRHRKGFYNLLVKERSGEDASVRTRYEMTIVDNHVTLNVDDVVYETTQKDPQWGIEMKFEKRYVPATKGKVVIYLCDELVDLKKKVTVTVNGKLVFQGKVKPDLRNMVNSCAAFFDPRRIYPSSVEVELGGK